MSLRATIDEPVPIQLQTSDGRTDVFVRAQIYKEGDITPISTLSLSHINDGLYGDTFIFSQPGYFTVQYQIFSDPGLTTPLDYDMEVEIIEANSDKTNLQRLLGINNHNAVLEPLSYDVNGCMTSAKMRAYDTAANAQLDNGVTGLLFSWTISVTYAGDTLSQYLVTLD